MATNLVADRLSSFQTQLPAETGVLLSDPADITYLTGFRFLVPAEREGLLLVTTTGAFLIQANFSPTIDQPGVTTLMGSHATQLDAHVKTILKQQSIKRLMVDMTKLFADEYQVLQKAARWKLVPFNRELIWRQRMIKDANEIAQITRASQIAVAAFEKLQPKIRAGVTEKDLQRQLDVLMFELGSEATAFPTIVAFGPHAALPHHQPTETVLTKNTPVLFDFGATYNGYRSDITRTIWAGNQPDQQFLKLEQIVTEAYDAVIQLLASRHESKKTLQAKDLDQAARDLITQAGYGTQFIHTTGHGVGLDIHEQPSLYMRNETELVPGMVITVEPGIYLTNMFGYRYENTVVLTDQGYTETTLGA